MHSTAHTQLSSSSSMHGSGHPGHTAIAAGRQLACTPRCVTARLAASPQPHLQLNANSIASTRQLSSVLRQRGASLVAAAAPARDLWGYEGSWVLPAQLDSLSYLHRMSFNHRNWRTHVVVIYAPDVADCQNIEVEVERLASGLVHEPQVVVTCLNASQSMDASAFVSNVLEVKELPAVFVYPEGSPGFMRYKGPQLTAEALLDSLNKCYKVVLPNREAMELVNVPTASAIVPPSDPLNSGPAGLVPATATSSATLATAVYKSSTPESASRRGSTSQSVVQEKQYKASSWQADAGTYWSPLKMGFWGFIAAFGVFSIVWERWGVLWIETKEVSEREKRRRAGERFDKETNADDLFRIATGVVVLDEVKSGTEDPIIKDNGEFGSEAKGEFARREKEMLGPKADDINISAEDPKEAQGQGARR